MRLHPAALGDGGGALLARDGLERIDFRAQFGAEFLGRRVKVDLDFPHSGGGRGVEYALGIFGGAAERRHQCQRAAVVDVGVVLPGESDATVHLDAVLGAVLRGDRGECGGHGGGEPIGRFAGIPALVGSLVERPRGVPHRRRRPLGGGDHCRALVLDGLELTDRPAELLTDLGVLRGGVGGPPGDTDRLSGQQRGDDRPSGFLRQVRQQCVRADVDSVGPDVGDRVQWVH